MLLCVSVIACVCACETGVCVRLSPHLYHGKKKKKEGLDDSALEQRKAVLEVIMRVNPVTCRHTECS